MPKIQAMSCSLGMYKMPRDEGDRPLVLWEEVGRGGRSPYEVENHEDRSYYPKDVPGR